MCVICVRCVCVCVYKHTHTHTHKTHTTHNTHTSGGSKLNFSLKTSGSSKLCMSYEEEDTCMSMLSTPVAAATR